MKEEVPADIASEVMSGTLTDWDRIYQNKMIPSENGQGLEILSGQIRVLHMCVTRWKKHEKEYRNKARYEQILSLAEECGYTDFKYEFESISMRNRFFFSNIDVRQSKIRLKFTRTCAGHIGTWAGKTSIG